jgi:hypothetical protein
MRLVKAVEKLEQRKHKGPARVSFDWVDVDGRRRSARTLAAVWSEQDDRLGRELAEGEYLAVDLHLAIHSPREVSIVRAVERATTDPEDRGRVLAADGGELGRVLEMRGQLLLVGWVAADKTAGA